MKTQQQILNEMIADFAASQDKVTYFGDDSVIRAIFHGISFELSEVWQAIYQAKRQNYLLTARGADLDYIGSKYSLARRSATKASAIVTFTGDNGSVVPAGTIIADSAGVKQYQTITSITLGKNYGVFNSTPYNPSINDSVLAESIGTGSSSKVGSLEINRIITTGLTGVSGVKNQIGSIGGADTETDEDYRSRIMERLSVLANDSQAFFEELAKEASSAVIKAKAVYDGNNLGTKIYVVKSSFANFTLNELNGIRNYIYARQKALSPVSVQNATVRAISLDLAYKGSSVLFTEETIFTRIADTVVSYLESVFGLGARIDIFNLYRKVLAIEGIDEIAQNRFKLNGQIEDIQLGDNEIPRFTSLTVRNETTIQRSITQEYQNIGREVLEYGSL